MSPRIALLAGFWVGLSVSCGATQDAPSVCDAACAGCCQEGMCLSGANLFACGAGGMACVACAANQQCSGGACQGIPGFSTDAAFPPDRDASVRLDAGVFRPEDASVPFDAGGGPSDAAVSFSADIAPIFSRHCGSCHTWNRGNLVGVAANCDSTTRRVVPGDAGASQLVRKIYADGQCGSPMPRDGQPLAIQSPGEASLIFRWIAQGALNN